MKKRVKPARQPNPIKRDLSQIRFKDQHWWKRQPWKEQFLKGEMPIEIQKAAMIYEGMRRRPEVQQAWLTGKPVLGDNEHFTGIVINHLPRSWVELDEIARIAMVKTIQLPLFVPPKGYSIFPENSSPEKCRQVAMQVLHPPEQSAGPDATKMFVELARRFEDAGFVIVAVDNKTKQAVRYAGEAIELLPRSLRKADRGQEWIAYLPANISDADRRTAEGKFQQGAFAQSDLEELHRKYSIPGTFSKRVREQAIEQTMGRVSPWRTMAGVQSVALHKRQRRESVIEEKLFSFVEICREFEQVDSGLAPTGDFIQRIRL